MTDRKGQEAAKDKGKPWTQAKGWDTSCPVSSFIDVKQVPDWRTIEMSLRVAGEVRQQTVCGNMLFGIEELISAVSRVHTLHPGDLILTGTPEGVGPVKPGDVMVAEIEALGIKLEVPVVL